MLPDFDVGPGLPDQVSSMRTPNEPQVPTQGESDTTSGGPDTALSLPEEVNSMSTPNEPLVLTQGESDAATGAQETAPSLPEQVDIISTPNELHGKLPLEGELLKGRAAEPACRSRWHAHGAAAPYTG